MPIIEDESGNSQHKRAQEKVDVPGINKKRQTCIKVLEMRRGISRGLVPVNSLPVLRSAPAPTLCHAVGLKTGPG